MASETFADELRAAVAGDKFTLYTELMLQAAELLDHKDEQINTRHAPVDANPLTSNPVDDKIAPDTRGNADELPSDGSCVRCGSVPRNASGLCNTCLEEDAARLDNTRPAPVATDTGLVTVMPLEWRKYRNGDAEAVTPFGEIYTAYVNGYWRITRNGKAGKFVKATGGDDVDAAKAGAQADFDANVLSLVRSQAEELLAAERAKYRDAMEKLVESQRETLVWQQRAINLKSDNAAKDKQLMEANHV